MLLFGMVPVLRSSAEEALHRTRDTGLQHGLYISHARSSLNLGHEYENDGKGRWIARARWT
jgi:hypothetical protein